VSALPEWLRPVADAAERITGADLTRFLPPDDHDGRMGAVLMLFGGQTREDGHLLLTERAHDMRSHPGQVSFPGGSIDPGETAREAALREAEEETGLDRSGVEVFGELPQLWLPPSNFAVTPVLGWWREPSPVRVVDPAEVHAVLRVGIDDLLDPAHRISVRHPRFPAYTSPAFLIGDARDLLLWGFTAGIITRLFDFLGWTLPWDESVVQTVPDRMVRP
jgi:8-oxo-dGTP pyrophosphatase MutT (NUDIX family)